MRKPEDEGRGLARLSKTVEGVGQKAFEPRLSKKRPDEPAKGVRYDLEKAVAVDSTTAASSGWIVFDCTDYVPSEARFAVLEAYGRCIDSPTGARTWKARRESDAIERTLIHVRGTTTSDITSMVSEAHIELSSQKTFEWQSSAMTEREIRLIGYVT